MDARDLETYSHILKERQEEIRREIENEYLLRDHTQVQGTRRRRLLPLAAAAVLVVIAAAAGAQLFV